MWFGSKSFCVFVWVWQGFELILLVKPCVTCVLWSLPVVQIICVLTFSVWAGHTFMSTVCQVCVHFQYVSSCVYLGPAVWICVCESPSVMRLRVLFVWIIICVVFCFVMFNLCRNLCFASCYFCARVLRVLAAMLACAVRPSGIWSLWCSVLRSPV